MKKLVRILFVVFCVTSFVSFGYELSPEESMKHFSVYSEDDGTVLDQREPESKTIHLEESLSFFEQKIDEFEQKAEEYQAFKESVGVGMLGALSALCCGDVRVCPLFIAAALSGLNRVQCRVNLHIASQLIGSALGAQLLLFFAGGW